LHEIGEISKWLFEQVIGGFVCEGMMGRNSFVWLALVLRQMHYALAMAMSVLDLGARCDGIGLG
jgi:hypothetical protein